MRNPFKRRRPLTVLLATQNTVAIRAAAEKLAECRRREAFTTGGALRLVKGANLVVLDPDGLTETDGVTREALEAGVKGSGAVVVSGAAFAADPVRYESEARLSVGDLRTFPARTIAHINYAGGVGKTTLSLDLAAYFARRAKLPAAVIELSQGASAFHALIDPALPHFYDMLTQGMEPAVWRGVTLVPMVYGSARLALDGARESALAFVETLRRRHVLTIFDVVASHPLWPDVCPMVDQVYVVVSPKPDSVLQAAAVVDDLREFANGAGPGDVRFVANLVSGPRDRLALAGLELAARLPHIGAPERFDGRLGRRLMSAVYPGFREPR